MGKIKAMWGDVQEGLGILKKAWSIREEGAIAVNEAARYFLYKPYADKKLDAANDTLQRMMRRYITVTVRYGGQELDFEGANKRWQLPGRYEVIGLQTYVSLLSVP